MPWKINREKDERWKLIEEWLKKKTTVSELARRFKVSRRTAHKWIDRFKENGWRGLADRKPIAKCIHNRPAEEWLRRIRSLRRKHPTWGAPKIHWLLEGEFGARAAPSEGAISRWLKKWKLSCKRW